MSKPIYEPSLPRTDAELGYGRDQLFRRPAPPSGNLIPGFHAYTTPALSVTSGVQSQLLWEDWIIDDPTVFEAGVLSGSNLTEVKFLLPGWYSTYCWAHWSSQPATGFGGICFIYDDIDFTEPSYHTMGVTYPLNWSSVASMTCQEVRNFPADFTQTQSFAWVNRLEVWVIQNSGISRTINEAYLNIAYLGPRNQTSPSS